MPYSDPIKDRDWHKRKMRERRANGLVKPRIRLVSLEEAASGLNFRIARAWSNADFSGGTGVA
jgi:hypothetical protein